MKRDKLKPKKPGVPEVRRYLGGLAINVDRPHGGESRLAHAVSLAYILDHIGPT